MKDFVVVKFGSELVTNEDDVDYSAIGQYASRLVESYADKQLVIVTSGAVRAGQRRLEQSGSSKELSLETLAQLGSASITRAWENAFSECGVLSGGLLVTHHELESREGPKFERALQKAGEADVVSIVNENDALSDTELMKLLDAGDNDGLASHIARMIGAQALVLFTPLGGVVDEQGRLISIVDETNIQAVKNMIQERTAGNGSRGGISSKVDAAWSAASSGVETVKIARPDSTMSGDTVTTFKA